MDININSLFYGNPTFEQFKLVQSQGFVDNLFENLKNHYPPANDSQIVKDELNKIASYVNTVHQEENLEFLNRYKAYDKNLVHVLKNLFSDKEIDFDIELLSKQITDDINPLILKLKYHFQRPRPFQLSYLYELRMFPFKSDSAQSPSYPSGHVIQSFVILNVISSKAPKLHSFCQEIIEDICNSRLYLGLHFESDNDFAKFVSKEILKNKDFNKKYNI